MGYWKQKQARAGAVAGESIFCGRTEGRAHHDWRRAPGAAPHCVNNCPVAGSIIRCLSTPVAGGTLSSRVWLPSREPTVN